MNKISKQLTELVNQKKAIVDYLNSNGVQASYNETLNTLVPKLWSVITGSGDIKLGTKEITAEGTYYAHEDGLNGYSIVDVNILGDASFICTFNGIDGSNSRFKVKMLGDIPSYGLYNIIRTNEIDLTSTKSIGDYGLYGNTNITDVIAPNSMKVGANAFYNCTKAIGTIKISEEQTVIEAHTFRNCQKLRYELHDNITEIEQYAFYNCQSNNLTALPTKLEKIGNYAFYQNSGIDPLNITEIPPLVTNIGQYAFQSNSFESIKIHDACTSISAYAFRYNSLKTVEIGKGLKSMYAYTFGNNTSLTTFTIHATTPPTILATTFQNSNNIEEIRVPASALEVYKSASNWSAYADIMVGIEGE